MKIAAISTGALEYDTVAPLRAPSPINFPHRLEYTIESPTVHNRSKSSIKSEHLD